MCACSTALAFDQHHSRSRRGPIRLPLQGWQHVTRLSHVSGPPCATGSILPSRLFIMNGQAGRDSRVSEFRNSLRSCPQRRPHCNSNNEVRSHALRAEQGNQAFLRGSASGARKRHPNLPRFACADLRFAPPSPLRFEGREPSSCTCRLRWRGPGPRRVC